MEKNKSESTSGKPQIKMKIIHKKAFSLIELMVVITIVGVLAAIAVPAYKFYLISSRISSLCK